MGKTIKAIIIYVCVCISSSSVASPRKIIRIGETPNKIIKIGKTHPRVIKIGRIPNRVIKIGNNADIVKRYKKIRRFPTIKKSSIVKRRVSQ